MQEYLVIWEMDIEADTPLAVLLKQAFAHMQRPGTTANVLNVISGAGENWRIDLMDEETGESNDAT